MTNDMACCKVTSLLYVCWFSPNALNERIFGIKTHAEWCLLCRSRPLTADQEILGLRLESAVRSLISYGL